MPRLPILLLAVATALSLAGCGNKGPLVMPDQQPKKSKHATAPATPAAANPAPSDGDGGR